MRRIAWKYVYGIIGLILLIAVGIGFKRYIQDYTSDFIDVTLYSNVLDEERKLFIRLPNNYDSTKRYPLVIKTDGNFNLARWDELLSEFSAQQKAQDSIVVAVPNLVWSDSRNRDLVPPYARREVNIEARPAELNSPELFGQADRFLRFIETELIPYIEQHYAVSDNRVLSGFSAGGSFVLYTLSTRPALFSGYFAFSPAAWYDDSVVVKEFASRLPQITGAPVFVYLSLGGEENPIITGAFRGLLSALDARAPANLHWVHSYSQGAGHVENPYLSLPEAIAQYHQFRDNL
ncbi:alpha/beta hydrolase [Bowmanella pacifica]|uniref:Alpha/beta hydrolase n=1 Tax=Bowmanella pacifica TaxID=502051 RepID=A0A917Z2G5_9ALTE|nr:alpha/beta hydrolase-fold protein [Bowmanella pacifica]GGO73281.1 hypothetical protein GCM10010982_33450 [Bowmanella pacifica]